MISDRCECGKVIYSYRQAREVINDARRTCHKKRNAKIPMREYHCELCGGWHVTKQSH